LAKPVYVKFEMPKELADRLMRSLSSARDGGKIRKGTNEVTKLVERGETLMVIMAEDVSPPEILMHMPALCDERNVPYVVCSEQGRRPGQRVWSREAHGSRRHNSMPRRESQALDELADKLKALRK